MTSLRDIWLASACFCGAVTVAGGAFAAHAIEARLDEGGLEIWHIGARYLGLSTVGLLAVSWRQGRSPGGLVRAAGVAQLAGGVIFAGSLWSLALTGIGWLGAITPLGGVGMITGWVLLAVAALKS